MPTSSARLKYCGASASSILPQPRRPLAPHELPPRQMRLTIRPERPSGPYFIENPPCCAKLKAPPLSDESVDRILRRLRLQAAGPPCEGTPREDGCRRHRA